MMNAISNAALETLRFYACAGIYARLGVAAPEGHEHGIGELLAAGLLRQDAPSYSPTAAGDALLLAERPRTRTLPVCIGSTIPCSFERIEEEAERVARDFFGARFVRLLGLTNVRQVRAPATTCPRSVFRATQLDARVEIRVEVL